MGNSCFGSLPLVDGGFVVPALGKSWPGHLVIEKKNLVFGLIGATATTFTVSC